MNIQDHAKAWREEKLKQPCEFCISDPIPIRGIFRIIDNFVYGNKCSMCFDLIEQDKAFEDRDNQIIKRVGTLE